MTVWDWLWDFCSNVCIGLMILYTVFIVSYWAGVAVARRETREMD